MHSLSHRYSENFVTVQATVFEKSAEIYAIQMQEYGVEKILEDGVIIL